MGSPKLPPPPSLKSAASERGIFAIREVFFAALALSPIGKKWVVNRCFSLGMEKQRRRETRFLLAIPDPPPLIGKEREFSLLLHRTRSKQDLILENYSAITQKQSTP